MVNYSLISVLKFIIHNYDVDDDDNKLYSPKYTSKYVNFTLKKNETKKEKKIRFYLYLYFVVVSCFIYIFL